MKKIIFASTHPMTTAQREDALAIWGADATVREVYHTWTGIDSVRAVAEECDILVGVFPLSLAMKMVWLRGLDAAKCDWALEGVEFLRKVICVDSQGHFVGTNGQKVYV